MNTDKFRMPRQDEISEIWAGFDARAKLDRAERVEYVIPEAAQNSVGGAAYWQCLVLYQDRPMLVWGSAVVLVLNLINVVYGMIA